jgi:hypothetical protein
MKSRPSNLAPAQLCKYNWRVDLFVRKYKESDSFLLIDGRNVCLKYDPDIEAQINARDDLKSLRLETNDGETLRLSDFAKTAEFGGGAGTGSGSVMTSICEAAQCVYAGARWDSNAYDDASLAKSFMTRCITDVSLTNISHDLSDSWKKSSIIGAELLFDNFSDNDFTFHHQSPWVNELEMKFKEINAHERTFTNINKWSPADIYLTTPKGMKTSFASARTIDDLNQILRSSITSCEIIGVSLKMLDSSAKISIHNIGEDEVQDETFTRFSIGSRGFFVCKDVYIYFEPAGKIQFRTFPQVFQGEIKGKLANHGKISYGPIQRILKELDLNPLHESKDLRERLASSRNICINELYEFYYHLSDESISFVEFRQSCDAKDNDWLYCKYLGCQLVYVLMKSCKIDEFIKDCIKYASSLSEKSAPFIKIQ